jgi:hypothetical protein
MAARRRAEMEQFVREEAVKRGIDPDIAVRVAESEALNAFDPDKPDRGGDEGSSFGLYQLHYKGMSPSMPNAGLGDEFTARTGLDARDPSTWKEQVKFSLDWAGKNGWGSWMGAKKAGIPDFAGISGRSPNAAGSVAPGAATGATSTGSAPAGTTLTTPTGTVAPYTLGVTPPAPTSAPAIIINQPSPFSDPIADANPWSDLGGAMASAIDPNKPQFLSGGTDGGAAPAPPDFESVLPATTGAAPDIAPVTPDALGEGGISPLGGAFRIAENIGKAGTPKLDRYGRPPAPVFSFG